MLIGGVDEELHGSIKDSCSTLFVGEHSFDGASVFLFELRYDFLGVESGVKRKLGIPANLFHSHLEAPVSLNWLRVRCRENCRRLPLLPLIQSTPQSLQRQARLPEGARPLSCECRVLLQTGQGLCLIVHPRDK